MNKQQLVLIVDDYPKNLQYIGTVLRNENIDFALAADGTTALKLAETKIPDLILLDINLPDLNGFEVCKQLKKSEKTQKIPVIFLSAFVELENVLKGFQSGAVDYVTKPIRAAELLARVKTQLELKLYRDNLEELVARRTAELENMRNATILGLARLAEYRDKDTGQHLDRIREFCRILARELAKRDKYRDYITEGYIKNLYQSSILHDIGKVGVPDKILLKPGKLTPDEFEIIKIHTFLGSNAIQKIESQISGRSFLTLAREIAYYHHEKWDGSGYPDGLKGEDIPLAARIVALADVYDALLSKRIYKEAFPHAKAKEIILASKGSHFDPEIVDAFLARENEFQTISNQFNENNNN